MTVLLLLENLLVVETTSFQEPSEICPEIVTTPFLEKPRVMARQHMVVGWLSGNSAEAIASASDRIGRLVLVGKPRPHIGHGTRKDDFDTSNVGNDGRLESNARICAADNCTVWKSSVPFQ